MKRMKMPGFTLIEISVVIAVAGMLILFAYNLFQYTVRVTSRTQMQMDVTMTMPIVTHLFKNDISTAFVPRAGWSVKKESGQENAKQEQQDTEQSDAKREAKQKPIERVFQAKESEEILQYITCISTNTLAVYENVQPRAVRLLYSVIPDEDDTYTLYRQESFDLHASLDEMREKKDQQYMLARGIKHIRMRFLVPKPEKQEEQQSNNQQQQEEIKPPEYLTFTEWGTDQVKEKVDTLVPEYVEFDFSIFDAVHNQTFDMQISTPIYAYDAIEEQQQKEKEQQEAKNAGQKGQRQG